MEVRGSFCDGRHGYYFTRPAGSAYIVDPPQAMEDPLLTGRVRSL